MTLKGSNLYRDNYPRDLYRPCRGRIEGTNTTQYGRINEQ